jgi:hypothetical protein
MLKKATSSVLASLRPSTYPRGYAFGSSLAAALLDGLFEHPAWCATVVSDGQVNKMMLLDSLLPA